MPDPSATKSIETDICIIGAGAAGLSVAATAGLLGVPVVLIERGPMGGDCLNFGCVPSKALIAAARIAHDARRSSRFGLKVSPPVVERKQLLAHIRDVIDGIAPVDSAERYRALGVDVIRAEARFLDARTVQAGDRIIRARRFVIATGAAPAIPSIPRLDTVPYLTNETLFRLQDVPRRLVVIGGGAVGVEMAQAHRRLGSDVTLVEVGRLLSREDSELVNVARTVLLREGVRLIEDAQVKRVQPLPNGMTLDIETDGVTEVISASHLLVATGRTARVDGLNLKEAAVGVAKGRILVDGKLRTSNPRIYAIGDCVGGPQFTHAAGYQASLVIRSAIFRMPVKVEYDAVPRVTFCDPEIASVGLDEARARAAGRGVVVYRFPMSEIDRARAVRETDGLIKVVVDRKGRILGAGIAGANAGELIVPWVLALRKGLKISDIADLVVPYPTLSDISKRVAVQSYGASLRDPWLGRFIRFMRWFG